MCFNDPAHTHRVIPAGLCRSMHKRCLLKHHISRHHFSRVMIMFELTLCFGSFSFCTRESKQQQGFWFPVKVGQAADWSSRWPPRGCKYLASISCDIEFRQSSGVSRHKPRSCRCYHPFLANQIGACGATGPGTGRTRLQQRCQTWLTD